MPLSFTPPNIVWKSHRWVVGELSFAGSPRIGILFRKHFLSATSDYSVHGTLWEQKSISLSNSQYMKRLSVLETPSTYIRTRANWRRQHWRSWVIELSWVRMSEFINTPRSPLALRSGGQYLTTRRHIPGRSIFSLAFPDVQKFNKTVWLRIEIWKVIR